MIDEAVTRSLWASSMSVRPWVRPDTGDGSNLKLAHKNDNNNESEANYFNKYIVLGSLPIWNSRVLQAQVFVLIGPCQHLLPVTTMQEHFVCLRLVERATHPSVRWMHCEDGRTAHPPALPSAFLEHALNIFN